MLRLDLGQRNEDEGAVEGLGMRQDEPVGAHRHVVVGDDVDVDKARTHRSPTRPSAVSIAFTRSSSASGSRSVRASGDS